LTRPPKGCEEQAPPARAARPLSESVPQTGHRAESPEPGAQASRGRAKSKRLDERLLAEGLAESRSRGQALIRAGRVLVDDVPVDKPGTRVPEAARIRLRGAERRFVSRGGEKLAGGLEDLGLDPAGLRCLDVGASTGGFTDCLLQAGARHVVAVDVGYGQLAAALRGDPRVRVLERRNARELEPADQEAPVDLVCVDVSFISVRLLLPVLARLSPRATLLVLVKPQFEVGRQQVGRGGVVRDPALRRAAADAVAEAAAQLGYRPRGRAESRLAGPKGNREIFLWLEPLPDDSLLSSPD
jgi:23S rRNA (cytidine1920-2'-O)/16S rRNA (cytidine1409-2'-O)-methyltransferase